MIIDDVVADSEQLSWYVEGLRASGVPVHFVRLMPSLAECERRDKARGAGRVAPGRVAVVYGQIETAGAFAGATIDSTRLSAQETADRVQALTTAGESIVWRPESASG